MNDEATATFLTLVREAMEKQNLTQADMAQRMACSRPYVSLLLHGRTGANITFATASKLAKALGMEFRVELRRER